MDKVRRFTPGDLPEISRWATLRGLAAPSPDLIPKVGFVEPAMACGFLYLTDSVIGILDLYLTNPEADKLLRKSALIEITSRLIMAAKFYGCRVVKADTQLPTIEGMCRDFHFKLTGHHSSWMREV